jgi:hypothetical protein
MPTINKRKIKDIFVEASDGRNGRGRIILKTFEPINPKKVSSTAFPKLYGDQKFSKKGDSVLEFFNITKGDPFNNYYSLRGYIAEQFVKSVLERKKYNVQMFSLGDDITRYRETENAVYKYFRGLPDIIYTNEKGEKTLLEIKSKSLEKKQFIIDSPPETEIMQGKMLALLENMDSVTMTYVMFDEDLERKIMLATTSTVPYDNQKAYEEFLKFETPLQLNKNIELHAQTYNVDRKQLLDQMKKAYKYAEAFRQTMTINVDDLSDDIFKQLFRFADELEGEQKQYAKPKRKG